MTRGLIKWGLALAPAAALLFANPQSGAPPHTYTVGIDNMKFGAVPAGLHPGDVIVWENRDIFRHTATAKDGSFNIDLPVRTKGKTVVKKAGAIPFFCKYHPGMKGVLKVAPK
jgi:plastocyanin